MFEKLSKAQTIGRMAEPEEVASLTLFLCSDEASLYHRRGLSLGWRFFKLARLPHRPAQLDKYEKEAREDSVMLTSTPETPEVTASERACGALFPSGNFLPFFLVTALFFLWGIPNNLNDVLIRHFMKSFAITRFQAGLIQSAFYVGYFLLAMPAALLMRKLGYKAGFVIGLVLFGVGAFLFWPAALAGSYGFFL